MYIKPKWSCCSTSFNRKWSVIIKIIKLLQILDWIFTVTACLLLFKHVNCFIMCYKRKLTLRRLGLLEPVDTQTNKIIICSILFRDFVLRNLWINYFLMLKVLQVRVIFCLYKQEKWSEITKSCSLLNGCNTVTCDMRGNILTIDSI